MNKKKSKIPIFFLLVFEHYFKKFCLKTNHPKNDFFSKYFLLKRRKKIPNEIVIEGFLLCLLLRQDALIVNTSLTSVGRSTFYYFCVIFIFVTLAFTKMYEGNHLSLSISPIWRWQLFYWTILKPNWSYQSIPIILSL